MSMNLSHEVDIDESTPMGQYQQINTGQYQWIDTNCLILMNLYQHVNIDESIPANWYWWIHSVELISTNLTWRIDIDKLILIKPDVSILTNLHRWTDTNEYPDRLILTNVLRSVNINESTLSSSFQQVDID